MTYLQEVEVALSLPIYALHCSRRLISTYCMLANLAYRVSLISSHHTLSTSHRATPWPQFLLVNQFVTYLSIVTILFGRPGYPQTFTCAT